MRRSPSFQRKLESRGGGVNSGSRPTALPGMFIHSQRTLEPENLRRAAGWSLRAQRSNLCLPKQRLLRRLRLIAMTESDRQFLFRGNDEEGNSMRISCAVYLD